MDITEAIKTFALSVLATFLCLILISCIKFAIDDFMTNRKILKAVKKLNIEEDLANCPLGINAELHRRIEAEIGKNLSALDMSIYLNALRKCGKIKPVNANLMTMKKRSTAHNNAVMLRKAKETDVQSKLEDYIARWGFREGIEIDMFNLTQRRLDELNDIYALIREITVTPTNLDKWERSEKYYVTISGYVLLVDFNKMREMAIDLECTCGSLYKLTALPESYVNEHLHRNGGGNDTQA